MKRVIDTSEVLGLVDTPEGAREVCAAADATYDEDTTKLVVKLEAFLRSTDLLRRRSASPPCPPCRESVTRSSMVATRRS
jgi:hypothetical protein